MNWICLSSSSVLLKIDLPMPLRAKHIVVITTALRMTIFRFRRRLILTPRASSTVEAIDLILSAFIGQVSNCSVVINHAGGRNRRTILPNFKVQVRGIRTTCRKRTVWIQQFEHSSLSKTLWRTKRMQRTHWWIAMQQSIQNVESNNPRTVHPALILASAM